MAPDTTYNIYGQALNAKGGASEHYLRHEGIEYRLDRKLVAGNTPYAFFPQKAVDAAATHLGGSGPSYGSMVQIGIHSLPGGTLDFKTRLPVRALWDAGGGLAVHTDKVGNVAWGYYMAGQGVSLGTALRGASLQGALVGGEDPLDQQMIERGFQLHGGP